MLYTAITRAKFQSTLLQEERHYVIPIHYVIPSFQSTLLQEERHQQGHRKGAFMNFNPRSYKRSDIVSQTISKAFTISIHAPTRGATPAISVGDIPLSISIHAPTRGATCEILKLTPDYYDFNPRSYKRSDMSLYLYYLQLIISIHAPTRGATFHLRLFHISCINFNPRSYKRSDRIFFTKQTKWIDFNPRSYKRSDSKNAQYSLCISAIIIA